MNQRTANYIDRLLQAHDDTAAFIQDNYADLGMPAEEAREIVQTIDSSADAIEKKAFGIQNFKKRQAGIMAKRAEAIMTESDEPYMRTYSNPMKPIEVNADEPYMKQYGDDQSSAVIHGKASNGRTLAPKH